MRVTIVGAGLTGLMAAAKLLDEFDHQDRSRRKESLQIEIINNGAAASPFVHGISVPLAKGDSIVDFEKDTLESGQGMARPALVQALCQDSRKIPELMVKMGLSLTENQGEPILLKALGSTYPRVASSSGHTGADLMQKLRQWLQIRPEVSFMDQARVVRLRIQEEGFRGSILWNERRKKFEYREADSILLAGGGFCGIYPFSTNQKTSGGDMIAMAYLAGIELTDLEFVQFEPSAAVFPEKLKGQSVITTMFYEGAVLRNQHMERFMKTRPDGGPGECVNKDKLASAIEYEIRRGRGTSHGGVYFDASKVGRKKLKQQYGDYVKRYQKVGIDIAEEPMEIAPAAHTSLGGILISPDGATNISGVYCAGEAAGGIHGANRLGGNAGLETLVFGCRAGREMFRKLSASGNQEKRCPLTDAQQAEILAEWNNQQGQSEINSGRLGELRKKMQMILQKDVGVIRSADGLQEAKLTLWNMYETLKKSVCGEKNYEKIRLENDVLCAALLASAASTRTNSIGCHIREDNIGEGDYHIVIHKGMAVPVIEKEKLEGR